MKIIFLDIDGVLNSVAWLKTLPEPPRIDEMIDREAVRRLNRLLDETGGAKIVVSSTWRLGKSVQNLQEILEKFGCTGTVIGKAPYLGKRRGYEIQHWLSEQAEQPERFVILDDDSDMEHPSPFLVQTTWQNGLLDEHVTAAAKFLLS